MLFDYETGFLYLMRERERALIHIVLKYFGIMGIYYFKMCESEEKVFISLYNMSFVLCLSSVPLGSPTVEL